MQPLLQTMQQTAGDIKASHIIRITNNIIDFCLQGQNGGLNTELIEQWKTYYTGIRISTLLALWHNNYHTLITIGPYQSHSLCCHLRNQLIALCTLINTELGNTDPFIQKIKTYG